MLGMPVPNLSLGSIARGATQAVGFLDKWPVAKKAVGFLGTPVLYDLNKEYGPNREKPSGGIGYYFKRYFSWGIAVSILASVGSYINNKFLSSGGGEQEQPSLLKSLGALGLKVLTFGGVIGSIYSEFQKHNVWFKCGEDAYNIATGSTFLSDIEVRENPKLISKTVNTPLRFNDGSGGEITNEKKDVEGLCNAKENELKAIFIGPSGTGKTEAMDLVVGSHVKRDPDKYIVWNINGNKVAGRIQEHIEKQGSLASLVANAGDDVARTYGAITQVGASKMLTSVLAAIKVEAKRALSQGKRLIVQFDEIDKLWNLAKGDDKVIAAIAGGLSDLWDCKDLDILFASNNTLQNMLGLGDKYKTIADIEQSPLANLWGRMRGKVVTLSNPTLHTQARIAATYLLRLPERCGVAEAQLFDSEILNIINGKSTTEEKEEALTKVIYDKHYKQIEGNVSENKIYSYISGRDLFFAITDNLLKNNLLDSGILKPGVLINIDPMLRDEINKATTPFRNVTQPTPPNTSSVVQQSPSQPLQQQPSAEDQKIINENIEALLGMKDEEFLPVIANQENRPFLQVVFQMQTPRANELKARILKFANPQQ